jgi:hypothetical protein
MTRLSRFQGFIGSTRGQFSMSVFKSPFALPLRIFLVFVGFISGNLIGQVENVLDKNYFLVMIVLVLEFITWLKFMRKNTLSEHLDILKRGFLLGVCVEAFKVGS